jgi:hypothetical protein
MLIVRFEVFTAVTMKTPFFKCLFSRKLVYLLIYWRINLTVWVHFVFCRKATHELRIFETWDTPGRISTVSWSCAEGGRGRDDVELWLHSDNLSNQSAIILTWSFLTPSLKSHLTQLRAF